MTRRVARHRLGCFFILLAVGCGGGGTDPGGQGTVVMTKASPSGDGQSAPLGTTLPEPLRVLLTDGGAPVAGRTVTWQILAPGGSVTPATTQTGADGIASTTVGLPPYGSANVVSAAAAGIGGSPQTFVATSTGAGTAVTVSVINDAFLPSSFDLKAGGTVTFTWAAGSVSHNVSPVAPATLPASAGLPGTHNAPFTFDAVFPLTGSYQFFCTAHGTANSGMRGTISVIP